jgi:hypothetical protein
MSARVAGHGPAPDHHASGTGHAVAALLCRIGLYEIKAPRCARRGRAHAGRAAQAPVPAAPGPLPDARGRMGRTLVDRDGPTRDGSRGTPSGEDIGDARPYHLRCRGSPSRTTAGLPVNRRPCVVVGVCAHRTCGWPGSRAGAVDGEPRRPWFGSPAVGAEVQPPPRDDRDAQEARHVAPPTLTTPPPQALPRAAAALPRRPGPLHPPARRHPAPATPGDPAPATHPPTRPPTRPVLSPAGSPCQDKQRAGSDHGWPLPRRITRDPRP